MPFQSEKQRRYLHANHPEIAKRWEKEYSHGGILDITGEEKITTDDGNDIELTDYNAEFDDPNDLSTGVKTLFRAKNGGSYAIQGGGPNYLGKQPEVKVPRYWKSSPDHPDTELAYITEPEKQVLIDLNLHGGLEDGKPNTGPNGVISLQGDMGGWSSPSSSNNNNQSSGGGHSHPGIASQYSAPPKTTTPKSYEGPDHTPHTDTKKQIEDQRKLDAHYAHQKYLNEKYDDYDSLLQGHFTGTTKTNTIKSKFHVNEQRKIYERAKAEQKKKMINMGLGKLIMPAIMIALGVPPKLALKSISVNPKDLLTAVKHSLPVADAKKNLISALEDYTGALTQGVDITNPNEMVNLEETTDFTDIMNELKDLTKVTEDDDTGEKDDTPQVVPVHEEIQGYEDIASRPMNLLGMRDNKALYASLSEQWADQRAAKEQEYKDYGLLPDNAVDNTAVSTELTMQANSGGLANLFRVKKQ